MEEDGGAHTKMRHNEGEELDDRSVTTYGIDNKKTSLKKALQRNETQERRHGQRKHDTGTTESSWAWT